MGDHQIRHLDHSTDHSTDPRSSIKSSLDQLHLENGPKSTHKSQHSRGPDDRTAQLRCHDSPPPDLVGNSNTHPEDLWSHWQLCLLDVNHAPQR